MNARQGDIFQVQKATQVTHLAVGVEDLEDSIPPRLLPAPSLADKGRFAAIKADGTGWETVNAPQGGGPAVSRTPSTIVVGSTRAVANTAFPPPWNNVPLLTAGAALEGSYASNLNQAAGTVRLQSGTYMIVFAFDLYTTAAGTTRFTTNGRFNVLYGIYDGSNVIGQQITNPYLRPVPDSGQVDQYGAGHKAVLLTLTTETDVGFRVALGSSTGSNPPYLATHNITIYPM